MSIPNNRKTFRDYCLRRLGAPVIDIDVDDLQVEDRIDEALIKFRESHYDGTENIYMKHQITQTDIDQRYITMPDLILGVTQVWPVSSFNSSSSLFNVNYQFALNDLFNIQSTSMVPYYMAMQHISLINDFFSATPSVRFNYHSGKLMLEDWTALTKDQFIVIEVYRILDPATSPKIWQNLWLTQYTTALIKRQWGAHLSKFNIAILNGVTYNGDQIVQQAENEIQKLEEELLDTWSAPGAFFIG